MSAAYFISFQVGGSKNSSPSPVSSHRSTLWLGGKGEYIRRKKEFSIFLIICCCSVAKSCPTLCHPMDCSPPGSSVLHYFMSIESVMLSNLSSSVAPSPFAFNLSQNQSFPMSGLFASGGQRIGASASASVLPMDIQGWFPLGLTVWFLDYLLSPWKKWFH